MTARAADPLAMAKAAADRADAALADAQLAARDAAERVRKAESEAAELDGKRLALFNADAPRAELDAVDVRLLGLGRDVGYLREAVDAAAARVADAEADATDARRWLGRVQEASDRVAGMRALLTIDDAFRTVGSAAHAALHAVPVLPVPRALEWVVSGWEQWEQRDRAAFADRLAEAEATLASLADV